MGSVYYVWCCPCFLCIIIFFVNAFPVLEKDNSIYPSGDISNTDRFFLKHSTRFLFNNEDIHKIYKSYKSGNVFIRKKGIVNKDGVNRDLKDRNMQNMELQNAITAGAIGNKLKYMHPTFKKVKDGYQKNEYSDLHHLNSIKRSERSIFEIQSEPLSKSVNLKRKQTSATADRALLDSATTEINNSKSLTTTPYSASTATASNTNDDVISKTKYNTKEIVDHDIKSKNVTRRLFEMQRPKNRQEIRNKSNFLSKESSNQGQFNNTTTQRHGSKQLSTMSLSKNQTTKNNQKVINFNSSKNTTLILKPKLVNYDLVIPPSTIIGNIRMAKDGKPYVVLNTNGGKTEIFTADKKVKDGPSKASNLSKSAKLSLEKSKLGKYNVNSNLNRENETSMIKSEKSATKINIHTIEKKINIRRVKTKIYTSKSKLKINDDQIKPTIHNTHNEAAVNTDKVQDGDMSRASGKNHPMIKEIKFNGTVRNKTVTSYSADSLSSSNNADRNSSRTDNNNKIEMPISQSTLPVYSTLTNMAENELHVYNKNKTSPKVNINTTHPIHSIGSKILTEGTIQKFNNESNNKTFSRPQFIPTPEFSRIRKKLENSTVLTTPITHYRASFQKSPVTNPSQPGESMILWSKSISNGKGTSRKQIPFDSIPRQENIRSKIKNDKDKTKERIIPLNAGDLNTTLEEDKRYNFSKNVDKFLRGFKLRGRKKLFTNNNKKSKNIHPFYVPSNKGNRLSNGKTEAMPPVRRVMTTQTHVVIVTTPSTFLRKPFAGKPNPVVSPKVVQRNQQLIFNGKLNSQRQIHHQNPKDMKSSFDASKDSEYPENYDDSVGGRENMRSEDSFEYEDDDEEYDLSSDYEYDDYDDDLSDENKQHSSKIDGLLFLSHLQKHKPSKSKKTAVAKTHLVNKLRMRQPPGIDDANVDSDIEYDDDYEYDYSSTELEYDYDEDYSDEDREPDYINRFDNRHSETDRSLQRSVVRASGHQTRNNQMFLKTLNANRQSRQPLAGKNPNHIRAHLTYPGNYQKLNVVNNRFNIQKRYEHAMKPPSRPFSSRIDNNKVYRPPNSVLNFKKYSPYRGHGMNPLQRYNFTNRFRNNGLIKHSAPRDEYEYDDEDYSDDEYYDDTDEYYDDSEYENYDDEQKQTTPNYKTIPEKTRVLNDERLAAYITYIERLNRNLDVVKRDLNKYPFVSKS